MHLRLLHPLFAVLLALGLTLPTPADSTGWPVLRGPARASAPVRYDPGVSKDIPAEFLDEAPVCYLYSGTTHRLEPDGTVEATTLELIRLNGRKGIDQLGEYRAITYDPSFEKVTLHEARVHKVRGGAEPVGARHVHVRDVNTDHLIYDPSKQLVISFPGLEVGDVLEVHWTTRGRHPEFAGHFFHRYTFGNDRYPVARDELTIRLPKARALHHASVNAALTPQVADEGEERVYRWSVVNTPIPPQGDHLPPLDERLTQVTCSTFTSWEEVHRWERTLLADRCACTPEVRRVVEEVTRGLTDPRDKARALTQWVRRRVRYVSAGEKHDYTPHPPAQVLANRYGDCKDTTLLLMVMLREAGLSAGVASLGVRGDGQVVESVPSPWSTHALVVVTIEGKEHWIDTTANLIGWDVLPGDDRDRACYVTDEQGIRLTRTPALSPGENFTEQTVHVSVGANGSLRGERTATYHGLAAWAKRDDFVDTPRGERRRRAAAELLDAYAKARLHDLRFDDSLDDFDRPLAVGTTFTVPEHFTGDTSREGNLGDHTLWGQLLSVTVNPERRAAIHLGDPFASVFRYVIDLPPALRLQEVPAPLLLASRWGGFRLEVNYSPERPHRLELAFHTRLFKSRVEPDDFEAFRAFLESVQAGHLAHLRFKPTDTPADAPPLEAVLAVSPGDTASAETLAKLYLTAERPDDARRVLERARHFAPGERALWELSLAGADDLGAEEELYREMVSRFPDEPKYRLDLALNLLDQDRPGHARQEVEPLTKHADAAVRGQALVVLARGCLAQEEPKAARRHLSAALEAHPTGFDAAAWLVQGEVFEALGEHGPARTAYRSALEKEPDAPDVLLALSRLTVASGSRDEALGYLRKLVVVAGDDAELLAHAADGFARLGRFDDALELASRVKTEDGGVHHLVNVPLGLALASRGEFAEALKHLSQVEPDADGLTTRIRCRLALGDLGGAVKDVGRARELEELTPDLRSVVGDVKALGNRLKELGGAESQSRALERFVCAEYFQARGEWPVRVQALVSEALADDARLGPALGLRAVLHLDRGRLTKALSDAEQAVALCPGDYRGYYARGRVRQERGLTGALDDYEKAARLSKRSDGAVLHALAAALAQAGRKAEALAAQREAVGLQPNNEEFQEQLRELERTP
jgi:tetratricopeptide (TPR) repeat protein/transglutaminase-like putative cysteine protease